ncbi:MAG: SMP-30/gluconolactonase/LRE family protein [Planctomycetaceae bacterium]|nr:SMP-30/gluconolactonase/LRE family protein [Planctomycetaceae bacterium]
MLETVPVPAAQVTSLCFGGRNLDTLFITTAGKNINGSPKDEYPAQPDAGGIFCFRPHILPALSNR